VSFFPLDVCSTCGGRWRQSAVGWRCSPTVRGGFPPLRPCARTCAIHACRHTAFGARHTAARGAPAPRDAAAAPRSTHSPPSWHPTPPYPRRFSRPRGRRIPPAPPPRRAASAFPRRAPPAAPGRASGLVRWGGRRWRRGPLGGGGPVATTARSLVATLRATAVHPLWSVATAVAPGVEQRGSAALHPRAATAAA